MISYLVNGWIYHEYGLIHGYIKIKEGKVVEIGKKSEMPDLTAEKVVDLGDKYKVIPGMIDVHMHGLNGVDVMDANLESLEKMAITLPKEGTTSFLATTITQEEKNIEKALINVANYIPQQLLNAAECLGVHLEGPFISPKRAGAQPTQHIQEPDLGKFKYWQEKANGWIRLVTLAPEEKNGLELTEYLADTGVVASIGHSDAQYKEVKQAIQAGASHVTHLFNGMSGMHHRDIGVAGGAWLRDELMVELIADGIHVNQEMIQLAYDRITSKRFILITDAMRAKCLKSGIYDLGGNKVMVEEREARLIDGTLAGSVLKMNEAMKNMHEYTNCSIENLIQMTSTNAAKQLNLYHRKGSITVGKDADLVIMDDQYNIMMTLCRGVISYERG